MATNIYCPECDKRIKATAERYGELYESVKGEAIKEMFCDSCYPLKTINIGDICFAAVLLPNSSHFNYNFQKPEVWMNDYINVIK